MPKRLRFTFAMDIFGCLLLLLWEVEQLLLPHVDEECSLLSLAVNEAMDIPLLLFLSLPPPPTLLVEEDGLSNCFDGDESVLSYPLLLS